MKTSMNFKAFIFAFIIAIVCIIPYELYMKNVESWAKGHDIESLDLWADWRGNIDDLTPEDVVILGSSRGHFDINIHLWDSIIGKKPIMLAYPGSSPFHIIEDVVEKSDFKGLLLISTAPGLFYTMEGTWGANRGKKLVDHYYDRTYAQKFSGDIYKLIDPFFSYLQGGDRNLTILMDRIPFPKRDSVDLPLIWPPMVAMDKYRNIRMIPRMEIDTALQRIQTDIWYNPDPKNRFVDSIDVVLGHYVDLVNKYKAKGGRVAFIRPPSSDFYIETETKLYPREKYWDRMLRDSDSPGYHFIDYEESRSMIPPEWSHLNRRDSDIYTELIIKLLHNDKLL
jgi:hypothetical protein